MLRYLFAWLVLVLLHVQPACAQALQVVTAGALKPLVITVTPSFEAAAGVKVHVQTDTAGAIVRRIQAGEYFDLVIVTSTGLQALSDAGTTDPSTSKLIAKVGIGVAIRNGATPPALASVEDFKRAVVSARRIAYIDPAAGGSSGIYMKDLFNRLGLSEIVQAKAVLVPGGLTAARLVSGEVDLAIQQASELMVVDGAILVGMLPESIQNYTTYGYAIASNSRMRDVADAFAAALNRPTAAEVMRRVGIQPLR